MPFEGARVVLNKGLSNHFQVNHTISMSQTASGYKFGATYVGTNIVGPGEAFPVLLGDIDPNGNLNANILCQFHPRVRTKAVVQVCLHSFINLLFGELCFPFFRYMIQSAKLFKLRMITS